MGRLRTNTKAPILIKNFKNYQELNDIKLPNKPICLEIGSGKGDFLITKAFTDSKKFYIGIEKFSTVILKALKKIERNELKLNNLVFSCADFTKIDVEKFRNNVSKIYLNFSDPWPKKRHAKRRLTSENFLNIYKQLLTPKGQVEFKTDNDILFTYTIEVLNARNDIKIIYKTTNLYDELSNPNNKNNVQTEYEKKFVALGKNINKIIWQYAK